MAHVQEVSLDLPEGWQLVRERITPITDPVQVVGASSYPAAGVPPPTRGCGPGPVLDRKPRDGALVQVVRSTVDPRVRRQTTALLSSIRFGDAAE